MTSSRDSGAERNDTVSTKKQREELKERLYEWVFVAIKEEWSTSDILTEVGKDWSKIVGTGSRGVDYKGLAEWQGNVLELVGVGTNPEVVAMATESVMTEVVEAIQEVFEGYPEDTITRAIGVTVVEKLLTGTEAGTATDIDVDAMLERIETGSIEVASEVSIVIPPAEANVHPAAIPSFLRKTLNRKSLTKGAGFFAIAGALSIGAVSPVVSAPYAYAYAENHSKSSNSLYDTFGSQSLIVASSVSGDVSRDGVTVSSAPAYSGTVVRPVAVVPAGSGNGGLVGSALKYVGSGWDCTLLVEQALRDMGYSVGDLAPMQFGAYGTVFHDPSAVQPGDIMMRGGHVSIYTGDGMAVQGGYNGRVVHSADSPYSYGSFVRVG